MVPEVAVNKRVVRSVLTQDGIDTTFLSCVHPTLLGHPTPTVESGSLTVPRSLEVTLNFYT